MLFLKITFFAATSLPAQQIRMGFVEDDQIIEKLPATAELQKVLDQETSVWDQTFQSKQQELRVYIDSLKAANDTLKAARMALAAADSAAAATPAANPSRQGQPAASDSTRPAPIDTLKKAAEVRRLENVLEKKKKETVGLYHKIYGSEGILKRRSAELTQSVLEKVDQSISEVCATLQVSLVFDSSLLLYVDQDINYTKQVMEALKIDTEGQR